MRKLAGSRASRWVAGFAGLLIVTQLLLPGRAGTGRGTPAAILFAAVVSGAVNALGAAGIILVYRTTRIINFAQTAIGAAGATLTFELVRFTEVPFPIALAAGLIVAGAMGLAFDLIFGRRFFGAPRLVLTVLTIVAAGFVAGVSGLIQRLPIFPPLAARSGEEITSTLRDFLPFPGFGFQVGDLPLRFGFAELFAIEMALVALAGLAAFFRLTKAGVAVRGMAENAERAALLGISVGVLSSVVWTAAGVLSGLGVALTGMLTTPVAAAGFAPTVLLHALAAAVLAGMRSLPAAVGAALGISIATKAVEWNLPGDAPLIDVLLFVVVAAGLLLHRRQRGRSEEGTTSSWEAVREQRPVPAELAGVEGVVLARRALIALAAIGACLYPFVTSTSQTSLGAVIALNAIVAISLVVLTGWAGQVSLGQFGFVAIGAIVGGALTARAGVPFWVAVPIAGAFTGAFAALIGLPALRLPGLFLAATTFAFSAAAQVVLFEPRYFGWLLPESIDRPSFFLVDFDDERSMYFLCVAALVACAAVVLNLRRGRFGRLLIALRDNEPNAQSYGVSSAAIKLQAFALSGALAGFAGALLAHQQRGLTAASFGAARSIDVFVIAAIGGLGSVGGALLGSVYFNVVTRLITNDILQTFLTGGGTLAILYAAPGGLISIATSARDSVLRIVAQRRQLVVPSLFADYDPEALARRLVPLGPPIPGSGVSALPASQRFTMRSELYRVKVVAGEVSEEGAALGAAARSVAEEQAL